MGRRRKPAPGSRQINGWLVVDKPSGISSAGVVARVLRELSAAKAGHGGTLDPLATGVLPVALGEATKTVSYVMNGEKTYRFSLRWGEARTTEDAEGEVTALSDVRPEPQEIEAALGDFVGEISQVPPNFSAIKVKGQRAYKLARDKNRFEIPPRLVTVRELKLLRILDRDHAEFEVICAKGFYIRSLARDLAARLGTLGHVARLRRTRAHPFTEDMAISLEKLVALRHSAAQLEPLLPVETALDDIPALALTENEADALRKGQAVQVFRTGKSEPSSQISEGTVVCAMTRGKPVALARVEHGEIRPVRVLNL
jgi:tRNA pseudouridine55 synthase